MSYFIVFFFKQKTAYEMRISDWSSDVCSSDLAGASFLVGFDGIRHSPHLCKRRHGYGGHMVECLHLWPLPAHSLHSLLAGATAFALTSATHACCLVAWAALGGGRCILLVDW